MKLRIKDQTARIRLSAEDLAQLQQEGFIENALTFDHDISDCLRYSVALCHEVSRLTAFYESHHIHFRLPHGSGREWLLSEDIRFSDVPGSGDSVLEVLLEKDLSCSHQSQEFTDER